MLEESSAEALIRDFLIPDYVPSLYNKIKTIAAKGVDDLPPKFNDFHRLFLYTHITPIYKERVWVIADGDVAGKKNIEKLQSEFKTWPKDHFINLTQTDIELYYPERFQSDLQKIFEIGEKRDLYEQKGLFNKKVMDWIRANRSQAKEEFKDSAKDIIEILKLIDQKLNT